MVYTPGPDLGDKVSSRADSSGAEKRPGKVLPVNGQPWLPARWERRVLACSSCGPTQR